MSDDRRRALRRSHKDRVRAKLSRHPSWPKAAGPRTLGRFLSTHGRPCSCWLCQRASRRPEPTRTPDMED